jgi:hypothetical protein
MNFLNRIFRSNMVECPRCLGKGKVDLDDIQRLKKELFWAPGKCAYCNGIGKVPPDRIEKVSADFEYLTTDLSSWERNKVINGDKEARSRANDHKEVIQKLVAEIEHLYYIENMEPSEIAEHLFHKQNRDLYSDTEKNELVAYIEKIIKSKRKN